MKSYILLITFSILFFIGKTGRTQSVANYAVSRSTGITYSSINSTGVPVSYWRNTILNQNDDNRSISVPIGFDFWYLGKRNNTVNICLNGYIDFSTTIYDGNSTTVGQSAACGGVYSYRESPVAFSTFGCGATAPNFFDGTYMALAPFYTDLWVASGSSPIANSIKYQTIGTAPNRVFIAEYVNMDDWVTAAVASYNFQVKLYESSGQIEFVYGNMIPSSGGVPPYGCGINSIITAAGRTPSVLKMQQTPNSTTFNNTAVSNLNVAPTSNSKLLFAPPCPATPTGALTITGITNSAMTLNWPNWATNEVAYVIYSSLDNVNFDYYAQTAANAVTYNVTGLLSNTTYYWKVVAVTEGCMSSALVANATTLNSGNKISRVTGNWNTATTWTPTGVPTSADNVTIANGHVVTIDVNAVCNGLTVGQGASGVLQYSGGTARSLTLGNQLTVNANATFSVNAGSAATHSLIIKNNIVCNGKLKFNNSATSRCNTYISNNISNVTFSGTGSLFDFSTIDLNLINSTNVLTINSNTFSAIPNFLSLKKGIINFSTVNAVNITPYNVASIIPFNTGIVLNSPNIKVSTTDNVNLIGSLTINSGTLNVGNVADRDLQVSGGIVNVNGGALNVAGKFYSTGINDIFNLTVTNGTITVPSIRSTNTTIPPFQINGTGSSFNMSNGLIVIPTSGGTTGVQNLGYVVGGSIFGAVTGGTLQIGSPLTIVNNTIQINSTFPVGNLVVNSNRAIARLVTNSLSVNNNVAINTGTLLANNLNLSLGGNWTDNGIFTASTGTSSVIFNSTSAAQSIATTRVGGEVFNNLEFSGAGVKTFSCNVNTNKNFTINSGSNADVSVSNYSLNVKGDFANSGAFNQRKGIVSLTGTTAQNISGTSVTNFYDLTLNNNAGATIQSSTVNLIGTLNLNNGTFNTNGKTFTMISNAAGTARIAQLTGTGDIIGNVVAQRFAPGGSTGWALLGTPISSSLTFADWDDNIYISCPTCPDGSALGYTSVYNYVESAAGSYSSATSYVEISGVSDAIVPTKGYWVYLGTATVTTADITLDVKGTVNKNNVNINLSRTNTGSPADDGWNLITNPYPSAISWAALKGTTTNIDNAIYAYNPDLSGGTGAHAAYVAGVSSPAVGSGGIGDVIPMCQGFYVHSTGATVLAAKETNKVAGNPTFLRTTTSTVNPLLRLQLNSSYGFQDETVLHIQAGASDSFDSDYDAVKLAGQDPYAPTICLEKALTTFQINGIAPISGSFSMPVKTITGYTGTYTISLQDYSSFPMGACINLYDKFTGITTNLKSSNYVFSLYDTTTVARFDLNIDVNPLNVNSNVLQTTCISPNAGKIIAVGLSTGPWNYTWKNDTGTTLKTSLAKATADTLEGLSGGNYNVEISTVGMCDNSKNDFSIDSQTLPLASFSSVDTVNLNDGGTINFVNTSSDASSFEWFFGDGIGYSNLSSPNYLYNSVGEYTVKLITTSATGCTDTTYKTIVVINVSATGINQISNSSQLIIKHIGDNEFELTQKFDSEKSISYNLFDVVGKVLLSRENNNSTNLNLKINLSPFSKGIYFLKLQVDGKVSNIKLVCE